MKKAASPGGNAAFFRISSLSLLHSCCETIYAARAKHEIKNPAGYIVTCLDKILKKKSGATDTPHCLLDDGDVNVSVIYYNELF